MRFRSLSAAVCAAPLLIAGCGSAPAPDAAPPPKPPPPKVSAEKVGWANQLCGLIGGFMTTQKSGPKVDKSNTQAFKDSSIAQIESAEKNAGQTQDGLRAMGPAPVPGGEQLTESFVNGFGQVRDVLNSAKAKAVTVDTHDQQTFTEGMVGVQQELKKGEGLNFGKEFSRLERDPELNGAAAGAPACRSLSAPPQGAPPPAPQPPR